MTAAERESYFNLTTDTQYLDLWSAYCRDLGENWPRYNGTALYIVYKEPILYHIQIRVVFPSLS